MSERKQFDHLERTHSGNLGGSRALVELRSDGRHWAWFRSLSGGGERITEPRTTKEEAIKDLADIVVPCSNCTEPATPPGVHASWSQA